MAYAYGADIRQLNKDGDHTQGSGGVFGAPGLGAVRVLKALAIAKNDNVTAEGFAQASPWLGRDSIAHYIKSPAATITTAEMGPLTPVGDDLMTALRPLTLLGRLPGLRKLPTRTRLLNQSTGFRGYWVREGKPIPMSGGAFTASELETLRVGALTVVSNELLRSTMPSVERAILHDLLAACSEAMDGAFIGVANAGVSKERPPSVTFGVAPIAAGGGSVAQIDAALTAAQLQLIAAGNSLTTAAWVLHPALAAKMAALRGSGGAAIYPGLGALGGELAGLPALTSAGADDATIALVDANNIGFAEGEPRLSTSTAATIDMAAPGGDPVRVSMFTNECTALLVAVPVVWQMRRPAVAIITGVAL